MFESLVGLKMGTAGRTGGLVPLLPIPSDNNIAVVSAVNSDQRFHMGRRDGLFRR